MGKKKQRTLRRKRERELDKLADAKEKLARLSEGGSPERPIKVVSASIVEGTAEGLGCARCGGELRVEEHRAVEGLRHVRGKCKRCSTMRDVWIVLEQRLLS